MFFSYVRMFECVLCVCVLCVFFVCMYVCARVHVCGCMYVCARVRVCGCMYVCRYVQGPVLSIAIKPLACMCV